MDRLEQPGGDQVAGKNEKKVYADPTRKPVSMKIVPDDDEENCAAAQTVQRGDTACRHGGGQGLAFVQLAVCQ